jgi:hypothetical protein
MTQRLEEEEPRVRPGPIEVFYAYAPEDEALREQLDRHLAVMTRSGVIDAWHHRRIGAGKEWRGDVHERLGAARVVLLLVSADFLASSCSSWPGIVPRVVRDVHGRRRSEPLLGAGERVGERQASGVDGVGVCLAGPCTEQLVEERRARPVGSRHPMHLVRGACRDHRPASVAERKKGSGEARRDDQHMGAGERPEGLVEQRVTHLVHAAFGVTGEARLTNVPAPEDRSLDHDRGTGWRRTAPSACSGRSVSWSTTSPSPSAGTKAQCARCAQPSPVSGSISAT